MYVPFASLLGLQAALEPLVHKHSPPEAAFGVDFVDPRTGGGSLLDHDSGSGLGESVFEGHTISPNGYNSGRDDFVKGAVGLKKYQGIKYNTVARKITGLIPSGSTGINHGIPTDGVVVLLTVTIS